MTLLASGFYSGYAPVASGSVGTLVAIPLALFLNRLPGSADLLATGGLTAVACVIAGQAEVIFGHKDSGKIVIDEIAGYLVTMLFFPPTIPCLVAAFFLFRFFDVVKPFPARSAETAFRNGVAVVMDDVVAGAYGNLCMWGLCWLGWLGTGCP